MPRKVSPLGNAMNANASRGYEKSSTKTSSWASQPGPNSNGGPPSASELWLMSGSLLHKLFKHPRPPTLALWGPEIRPQLLLQLRPQFFLHPLLSLLLPAVMLLQGIDGPVEPFFEGTVFGVGVAWNRSPVEATPCSASQLESGARWFGVSHLPSRTRVQSKPIQTTN